MNEETKCCHTCILGTGTLILLWIMKIGCIFHIYINFYRTESVPQENQNPATNVENNIADAGTSDETIRKKRSLDLPFGNAFSDLKNKTINTFNKLANTTGQIAGESVSAVKKIAGNIQENAETIAEQGTNVVNGAVSNTISNVEQIREDIRDTIKNTTEQGTDVLKNTANKTISSGQQIHEDVHDVIQNVFDQGTDFAQNTVNSVEQIKENFQNAMKNITEQGTDALKNTVNNAISSGQQISEDVHDIIQNVFDQGTGFAQNTVNSVEQIKQNFQNAMKNITDQGTDVLKNVANKTPTSVQQIPKDVHDKVQNSVDQGANSAKNSVDKRVSIVQDTPKSLTFSVIFFYISIVVQIIIMLEINFDSYIECQASVLSELAKIDWRSLLQDSMVMINFGFLISIVYARTFVVLYSKLPSLRIEGDIIAIDTVLSIYFLRIIKRCRSVMLEKEVTKEADLKNDTILLEDGVPDDESGDRC